MSHNLFGRSTFLPDYPAVQRVIQVLKDAGYKIVLTQGVFDLLHIGHVRYLEKAKEQGDILIVGVDSDDLTRARKGPGRPLIPQEERVEMLKALRLVDFLVLRQKGEHLDALVEVVLPDVLVISYSTKDIDEEVRQRLTSFCKKLVILEPQATTSTTARILDLEKAGAGRILVALKEFFDRLKEEHLGGDQ